MRYIWEHNNWPNVTWQSDPLIGPLGKARLAQGRLLSKINTLRIDQNNEAHAVVLVEEAIKTAEIEGQKLNEDSVRSSVARRLGLPYAGLPQPDRQTEGLVDILFDTTSNYNKALTEKRLKSWQAALFPTGYSGLVRIKTGQWRGPQPMRVVSGPVGKEKIHFEAPPYDRVPQEVKAFLLWFKKSQQTVEGILRAAAAHFWFVTIHPFEDGNGRIARALTDMGLAQDENLSVRYYSLSSKIMEERDDYYNALEKCQKGKGDITDWLIWFLGCFERAVKHSEGLISSVLLKAQFWNRLGQTPLNANQRKVLNKLLDAEPKGFEGGLTTRKYVSIAKVSRATAYRDIADLVQKKALKQNPSMGRNVNYSILLR